MRSTNDSYHHQYQYQQQKTTLISLIRKSFGSSTLLLLLVIIHCGGGGSCQLATTTAFVATTTTAATTATATNNNNNNKIRLLANQAFQLFQSRQRQQSVLLYNTPTKDWDAILSADDDNDTNENNPHLTNNNNKNYIIPYDMKYNQRNCERCQQNFKSMQNAGSPGADIYGCTISSRSSSSSIDNGDQEEGVFWFLGKVSHISDITIEQCIVRLWPMIQQHAANLRPLDLFGAVTNDQLTIWYAPLNTEFDVAYNRPSCTFTQITIPSPLIINTTTKEEDDNENIVKTIKNTYVGFQGEIYEPGEEGFRTMRYIRDGTPSRSEITGPSTATTDEEVDDDDMVDADDNNDNEMMIPNDEQMEEIQKALEGKDINAIYEEQERRRLNKAEQKQN